MRITSNTCLTVALWSAVILTQSAIATAAPTLTLASPAFDNGGTIPRRYTCSGDNESPALKWTGVPGGTRSLALIVADPDAPMGTFVHWVVYNLPPANKGLPESVSATAPGEGEQGKNGRGTIGYTGPCPPPGRPHHYHFWLYALDQLLELNRGATAPQLEAALRGHIVDRTELVGIFGR